MLVREDHKVTFKMDELIYLDCAISEYMRIMRESEKIALPDKRINGYRSYFWEEITHLKEKISSALEQYNKK